MSQFKSGLGLMVIALGMLLVGCGDGKQSDLAARVKVLLGGESANPTAAAPDPQQARQNKLNDLHKKAEAGDVLAMVELGKAYEQGRDWGKSFHYHDIADKDPLVDLVKAAGWFEKAAKQGNTDAQYNLASMYGQGNGMPKDMVKAVEWYQKAAAQNHSGAQSSLGEMYAKGEGVQKDIEKAKELWQQAVVKGDPLAQMGLGWMYRTGTGVPKDTAKAIELLQLSVAQGHPYAQIELGVMYQLGDGMPKDEAKAMNLFLMAAEQGNVLAQEKVAMAYSLGEGVPKDKAKALAWNQKAAVQGSGDSQYNLGTAHLDGWGITKDVVLAYAWLNLAANDKKSISMLVAQKKRDELDLQMAPDDLAEAQRLSSAWKPGQLLVREGRSTPSSTQPSSQGNVTKKGTGTAFILNKSGQAITNYHVIDGCTEVRAEGRDGVVKVVTSDVVNDLAQLQIPGTVAASASISSDPTKLRQGEDIAVFGFPLNSLLSSGGNLTPGIVSAITGLGNNTNQIQITAPIQPGSSGSPVLNKKGEIVAVVSMKLSDSKMAKATGQIGQNVNFAVSGQTLRTFLDTHKVEYRSGGFLSFEKSMADLADEARKWTLVVECWK